MGNPPSEKERAPGALEVFGLESKAREEIAGVIDRHRGKDEAAEEVYRYYSPRLEERSKRSYCGGDVRICGWVRHQFAKTPPGSHEKPVNVAKIS